MNSTRLPGKALLDVAGAPLFERVIQRVRRCVLVDDIWLATTAESADDALAQAAITLGVKTYRGSTEDVLDRMYQTAKVSAADVMVRVTADDPLKDPGVTEMVIRRLLEEEGDYSSNTLVPTFPEGVDIEAITMDCLENAWRTAVLPSDREHVTPFVWRQPSLFKLVSVTHPQDLSALRWTVDYPADLEFARAVYQELGHRDTFEMGDVLQLLELRPELAEINAGILRNEGYHRSLEDERNSPQTL
jgi:spore coat polysaccharide biosynthesis protein SpsF (cytidylyltransferase family)